jgi:ATP-binding protein involved in chromosome partitioning
MIIKDYQKQISDWFAKDALHTLLENSFQGLVVKDDIVYLTLELTKNLQDKKSILQDQLLQDLKKEFPFVRGLEIVWHKTKNIIVSKQQSIQGVKKVIVVASGKGGVGKSTLSMNLALAINSLGYKVGILDNDIYGPSLPIMAGITEKPFVTQEKKFIPIIKFGIKMMSIGFLVPQDEAVVWRGLMVQSATQQMLESTDWNFDGNNLDFLIIDLPPGTGDVQLTITQKIKIDGSVIVSTPQDLAFVDAKKAINMFKKLNIEILGIVENMSHFICQNCHHETKIFKGDTIKSYTEQNHLRYLGFIPLDEALMEACDQAKPIDFSKNISETAEKILDIAKKII